MTAAWILTFWLFAVGWFCCACEVTGNPCENCPGGLGPDALAVTFTGLVDGRCDCDAVNTTFICPPTADCYYGYTGPLVEAYVGYIGANLGWIVRLEIGCGLYTRVDSVIYQWDSGSPDPFDCRAPRDLAFVSHTQTGSGSDPCLATSWSSTTCRVN